jgi:hypothetical protein
MPAVKLAKAAVATVVVAALLWASGVTPAIVPANVPTANKQGSTGTKFFICTGAFVAGNVISTDASGNCVDSGGTGGGAGFTVYSGLAGITISGGVTAYFPFGGGSIASTTETDVTVNLRAAATVSSFTSHLSAALGGPGNTVVFTLRKNAGDTTITCTITDPAVECSDTVNSVTFATGDTIDIKAVFTGTIAVTPNFVLGAVVGVASSPLVSSVFGQTGVVDIPVTTTDIATPANPGAGTTKWYTKAGTLCALDPSGTETCTGGGGGIVLTPPIQANWTAFNTGTATLAPTFADARWIFATNGSGANNLMGLAHALPGVPYRKAFRIWPFVGARSYGMVGIGWADGAVGTPGKLTTCSIQGGADASTGNVLGPPGLRATNYNSVTSFNANIASPTGITAGQVVAVGLPLWMALNDDNTNWFCEMSYDSTNGVDGTWRTTRSGPRNTFLTATQLVVFGNTAESNNVASVIFDSYN